MNDQVTKLEFVSPVYDTTFRYLWKNKECRYWITKLLKLLTNIDLGDYTLYDPILSAGNKLKDYEMDILFLKVSNVVRKADPFNIEMYKDKFEYNELKSRLYIFKVMAEGFVSGDKYIKRY